MPLPLRRVLVTGPSMVPTLRHGDRVVVWFRRFRPRPGDVVVVRLPDRPLSVKRLVRREDAGWWVEGDNPLGSTDSRDLGAVPADAVVGRVVARVWPRPRLLGRRSATPDAGGGPMPG